MNHPTAMDPPAFLRLASGQPLPVGYSLILPLLLAGGLLLGIRWLRRRRRILLHGLDTTGWITAIEPTPVRTNGQVQHRIILLRTDNGLTVSATVHRRADVKFFRDRKYDQQPVAIRYDPDPPERILLPDVRE